ncbi:acyl-CoA dehydrogenase [Streptomyces sp. NPDC094034]|uniref:acyl-CoA dehydrogenase n=1 Tax=Streptomyces sp. NPDC094034 TaxID=3155309 RepID=UPI0033304E3C
MSALIHDDSYEVYRTQLRAVFSDDVFTPRQSQDPAERFALTYRRLRHVNDSLDVQGPLLHQRERLFPLIEWSAIADPSLFYAMFLHHCMTVGAIAEFGHGRQDLVDVLDKLAGTDWVGALLMTELGHGNSNASVRTEAVYDRARDEFVLHTPEPAAVKFPPSVGAEGLARLGVVLAQLKVDGADCGEFCFLVPLRDEHGPCDGVRIEGRPPTAMLPLDCAVVSFDHVRVPFRHWLRDNATLTAETGFADPLGSPAVRARRTLSLIRYAWEAAVVALAGTARASAAIAVRHAHRRRTNGRFAPDLPVVRYRNQQRTVFGALAGAYVAALVAKSVATPQAPALTAGGVRTSFLMKVVTDRLAEQVTARCRRASGALGFLAESRFLDYQGLAHSLNAAAADNQVLLLDAAYALAAGLDYEPPAAEPAAEESAEPLPAPGGRDLLDHRTWLALARVRERTLHQDLLDGLRKAKESGLGEFDAWNGLLDLAERLAETHAGRLVLETVTRAVDSVTDPATRAALDDLCALYALEEAAAHDGWYLAEGLLDKDQVRAIPTLLDTLCERLAPHALELADGLDVPYDLVGGPLVADDYVSALSD